MHNPDDKPSNCFILLMFSNFFNFHAIHEREPWTYHYRWNRRWLWRRQKEGYIVSHQLGVSMGYGCWGTYYFKILPTITQDLSRRCVHSNERGECVYVHVDRKRNCLVMQLMLSNVFAIQPIKYRTHDTSKICTRLAR